MQGGEDEEGQEKEEVGGVWPVGSIAEVRVERDGEIDGEQTERDSVKMAAVRAERSRKQIAEHDSPTKLMQNEMPNVMQNGRVDKGRTIDAERGDRQIKIDAERGDGRKNIDAERIDRISKIGTE